MSSIFEEEYVKEVEKKIITLFEKNNNVDMEIVIKDINNRAVFLRNFEGQGKFPLFRNKKCADFILLEFLENCKCNLHIFELKRTVNEKIIENIRGQFIGALYRSFSILPFYDFKIKDIINIYLYIFTTKVDFKDVISYRYSINNTKAISNLEVEHIDNSIITFKLINIDSNKISNIVFDELKKT